MDEARVEAIAEQDALLRPPTYYELLDVNEDSTETEIDHAFAKFLQAPSADLNLTAKRKHAWEVLRDQLNRSFYDEHLAKLRAQNRLSAASTFIAVAGVGSMSMFTMDAAAGPTKLRR